jgi:Zn-dependent M16 (insulinase) family peptidase
MEFLETVGAQYCDFLLTKVLPIRELNCTLKELLHIPSGAQVMHIGNEDPENLFCLSLKTYPRSSNGAPHILEHTVLCGSRKYPVKDPFFSMTRRSLNTFMNALTGSDFTCYPAASQVEKDFYNLLEVYLDAVFHPKLKEMSFLQEGCRLEFATAQNPQTPLEYKGIVYNEMKGSLASVDVRLWHALIRELVPDLPYAFNSGGDPKEIPNLTYSELIAFHETYYHPSRCLFYFYGNIPLKHHLDFIAEKALKNVPREPPIPPLPRQRRFLTPKQKTLHYPVNEDEDLVQKALCAFGWLTVPLIAQEDVLALTVLDAILVETDASPLKHALLQSGLCIQADGFIDTEMSEIPYIIVCKGVKEENAPALKNHLFASLRAIVEKGIPHALIEAAIHQIEFDRTEINGEHSPFGLTLFMRSGLAKQHGCPPENALTLHTLFENLLRKAEDPTYLPNIIQKYLIDNPHFVELLLLPDPKLNSKELSQEKEHLEKIKAALTKEETEHLIKQSEALKTYQKKAETQSIDCLPKVTLEDVPLLARDLELKEELFQNLRIFHHPVFTNKILYVDLVYELPEVAEEELPYVHLLSSLLSEIGMGGRSYTTNLDYIQANTGGIGASCGLSTHINTPFLPHPFFLLRGKALMRKDKELLMLLHDMVTSPRFDEKKRIEELILQVNNALQSRFNRQALRYATQLSLSGFSQAAYIYNAWNGLPYFKWIQKLARNLDKEIDSTISKLETLHARIFSQQEVHCIIACDQEMYEELKRQQFHALNTLPSKLKQPWIANFPLTPVSNQARIIASPVAFTTKALKTVTYLHPHAPALSIATELFDNTLLHKMIREEGGAYGSGATYVPMSGAFYFHSYRDPNLASTLTSFDKAIEEISLGRFDARDLEEAKLGLIQQLDSPSAPGTRAMTAYGWWREGKTHPIRQNYREKLLSFTEKEVRTGVEKELLPKRNSGIVISFAGKELIEQENQRLNPPLPIIPI